MAGVKFKRVHLASGVTAEKASDEPMVWLSHANSPLALGLPLEGDEDEIGALLDEETGDLTITADACIFTPATKQEAKALAKLLGTRLDVQEKLSADEKARLHREVEAILRAVDAKQKKP